MSTAKLLAENINSHVFNAVDGPHEHLTQALLDILTIRRRESGKAK